MDEDKLQHFREVLALWHDIKYFQTVLLDDVYKRKKRGEQNVPILMPVSVDFKEHQTWPCFTAHTWCEYTLQQPPSESSK